MTGEQNGGSIEILASGILNSVQDLGRRHSLGLGVSIGGAMDRLAMAVANSLVGNDISAAGIEVVFFPFRVKFHGDTIFALTGADTIARLDGVPVPPSWAMPAKAGQTLALFTPRFGARAYLAVAGGIDVPDVLSSCATDMKCGFGGFHGRGLQRGDRLLLGKAWFVSDKYPSAGWGTNVAMVGSPPDEETLVRILPAAEWTWFAPETQERFLHDVWKVTSDANRVGYRLNGMELPTIKQASLLSHGIVPGTVQVPPSGLPIVQLADANTCGGYPKIATVIEADQRLLAQTRVGGSIRFALTTRAKAHAALKAQRDDLSRIAHDLQIVFS